MKELFLTILLRGALGAGRRGFSTPPAACHTIQDKHLLLFHQSALRCAGSGPCLVQKRNPPSKFSPGPNPCPRDKQGGVKQGEEAEPRSTGWGGGGGEPDHYVGYFHN